MLSVIYLWMSSLSLVGEGIGLDAVGRQFETYHRMRLHSGGALTWDVVPEHSWFKLFKLRRNPAFIINSRVRLAAGRR